MKTNAKKRMLISSVAMLLVAMIALGTATFAWFTSNTSATADDLSVKTVKASELKLSSVQIDWTDSLHYNYLNKVLKPASSANGVDWFSATAAGKDSFAADASSVAAIKSQYSQAKNGIADYVFMDQLNVANFGGADVENVKIEFALSEGQISTGKKYLRLALVPASRRALSSDTTGLPAIKDGEAFDANVYSVGPDTADAFKTASATATVATIDASSTVSVNVGTLTGAVDGALSANGAKYYNLYVWFEGQDVDCADANAGNDMPKLTFTVTGDTKSQQN